MNNFLKFFYPKFLQRFDHYLLVNYPVVWETKAHFVAFYSFFVANIVLFSWGVLSYVSKSYINHCQEIYNNSVPIGFMMVFLGLGFYIFYLNVFQNKIKYYTFSQIFTRFGLMSFVIISFVSNVFAYFLGVYVCVNVQYDISQVREELRYIRKMEIMEDIITRLYSTPLKEKKHILEKLKNSHFNQNNEVSFLLKMLQKTDDFAKKMADFRQNDILTFEKIIKEYTAKNPSGKYAHTGDFSNANKKGFYIAEYGGENRHRGNNQKTLKKITYYDKQEYVENVAFRILYEGFVFENFKSPFVISRFLRDNVPMYNLTQYKDVPWTLELPKVHEILEKYPHKMYGYSFPELENMKNILTFSTQKNDFNSSRDMIENFVNAVSSNPNGKIFKDFQNIRPKQNEEQGIVCYFDNYDSNIEEKQEKQRNQAHLYLEIQPVSVEEPFQKEKSSKFQALFFKHYVESIDTPRKFFSAWHIPRVYDHQIAPVVYIFAGFVILMSLGWVVLFSKLYNFQNLLASMFFFVGYLVLFPFLKELEKAYMLFGKIENFLMGSVILVLVLYTKIYKVYRLSRIFWLVCLSNLFFLMNSIRFMTLLNAGETKDFMLKNLLVFAVFVLEMFWVYVVCNDLLKKPLAR